MVWTARASTSSKRSVWSGCQTWERCHCQPPDLRSRKPYSCQARKA